MYALVTVVGQAFGLSFTDVLVGNVLVGIAGGAAVALVRVGSPAARAGAFLVGYFVTIVFYLIRVGLLPVNAAGLVIFGSGCLLVITIISALTKGRLPLFAMLIGAVVFSGTMEAPFNATPWYLLTQLTLIATGLLVPVAAGFLVVLLVEWQEPKAAAGPDAVVPAQAGVPVQAGVAAGAPAGGGDEAVAAVSGADPGLGVLDGSSGGSQS
jgi:hypothetical protein